MNKIKIATVGPIPRDTIITHKGEVIKKYGCITHPTIALSKLLGDDGLVFPVTHINKEDEQPIKELFEPYPNINTSGLYTHHDRGTIIELKFLDQNNREEKQLSKMAPITPEDVKPFLDVDAFVFVPVTDFEIDLETLKYIKENSDALIIFDAHGPTSRVDENGARVRKLWEDKNDWLPYIDVLKMNLEESQFSWCQDEKILNNYDDQYTDHLDDFAEYALSKNVNTLYITLDSRGCLSYHKENGETRKEFIKSVWVDNVVDTTGCGDSFAGGLAYGLALYKDRIKAAQYANLMGALRTQGTGFDVFKDREESDKIIEEYYSS